MNVDQVTQSYPRVKDQARVQKDIPETTAPQPNVGRTDQVEVTGRSAETAPADQVASEEPSEVREDTVADNAEEEIAVQNGPRGRAGVAPPGSLVDILI